MSKKKYNFIIDNKLYDLSSFVQTHPGGLDICYFADHDVSIHYKMIHGRSFDHEKMKKYLVRDNYYNDDKPHPSTQITAFGQEIISEVNKLFKNKDAQAADWRYYTKAGFIYLFTLMSEICHIYYPSFYGSVALGVCYALIGLNITHDATHGALGRHKWFHEVIKYTKDWIGGSKVMWLQQHVLSHHAYTNDVEWDNDMTAAEPFLVFHPKSKKISTVHAFQHLFYMFVLKFYALSSALRVNTLFRMQHYDKFPTNEHAMGARLLTLSLRLFFFLRLLILPAIVQLCLGLKVYLFIILLKFLAVVFVEGFILAFLFLISHNFEGTEKINFTSDWHMDQVISSSTYGGSVAGFVTGGLNYQIEHHLFPRISHVHYPRIHPKVKEVCLKHNVKYTQYDNVIHNLASTLTHLKDVGSQRIQSKMSKKQS